MIILHLKRNLLASLFIIVLISVVWLIVASFLTTAPDKAVESKEINNYVEKIDNFVLQTFNDEQKLAHLVEAKQYFSFKKIPALLVNPVVTTYDKKGKQIYTMRSKRANYLDNGDIKFNGKVDIKSNTGLVYKMDTEELIVNAKTSDLFSNKVVNYLDETAKVTSQGMRMIAKQDKLYLSGQTHIHQDSGQKILTHDLIIDQSNTQKRYYTKKDTVYTAYDNKVYAQGVDMDINKSIIKLLDKVTFVRKSGVKINTKNLVIDQSNNKDIYSTKEKVHYQSQGIDIYATGMRFDAKNQKIKLTGGVTGYYE